MKYFLAVLLAFTTCTVFIDAGWPLYAFQLAAFCGAALQAAAGIQPASGLRILALPLYGLLQLTLHTTVSTAETRAAVLTWGSLAAVFLLSRNLLQTQTARRVFLTMFLCFATAMAALCLLQLFTSHGRVLWLFDTGYPDVFGTFPYHNNYAQFVELALPIALWGRVARSAKIHLVCSRGWRLICVRRRVLLASRNHPLHPRVTHRGDCGCQVFPIHLCSHTHPGDRLHAGCRLGARLG